MSFLKNFRSSRRHSSNSDNSSSEKKENTSVIRIGVDGGSLKKKNGDFKGILKPQQQEQHERLQRSDTFTIQEEINNPVNSKSSHKPSVFEKFSTFTRKKKSPPKGAVDQTSKHEGTYKRWPTPSDPAPVVDDPFDILYIPQRPNSPPVTANSKKSPTRPAIDYGTYRKSKTSSQPREPLEDIRFDNEVKKFEYEDDRDKFRTVTINSFRKSFREKVLAQKNDEPYNPSWFVEIEPPPKPKQTVTPIESQERKSRPTDIFVFDNDNYRPTARSPVRKEYVSPPRKSSSSVKRTDTFKIEREHPEPSFRIEIKNSITSNEPGRLVPVGVAKPMPSSTPLIVDNVSASPVKESPTPAQNLYCTRIQINGSKNNENVYMKRTFTSPVRLDTLKSKQKVSPNKKSDPIISDYSPLTSYEILTKLRNPSEPIRTDPIYVGRVQTTRSDRNITYGRGRNTTAIQIDSYDSRPKTVSPTKYISGRQIIMDQAVRKESTNTTRYAANIRKPQTKAPWR